MTDVIEELTQATILAQMQAQLTAQADEIRALREAQAENGDGSLETAIRLFSEGKVSATTFTSTPCQAMTRKGTRCLRDFESHIATDIGVPAKVRDHTFRMTPFVHEPIKGPSGYYKADNPVVDVAVPEGGIEDTYCTEKQAAERLGMTVPALRKLVKEGQLKADRIGTVVLLRKASVERLVALQEIAKSEGMAE